MRMLVTGTRRDRLGALVPGGLFALLAVLVAAHHGAPLGLDLPLHRWALRHRHDGLTTAAVALTSTGTGLPAYVVAAVAGAAARRRPWRGAVLAVAALAAGQLVRVGLLTAVGRPRPPTADWAAHASGSAFPSGHTTSSALVAAVVCLAVLRLTDRRRLRAAGCSAALLWAAGVGATRVYLGVHWPTDILGGWLLAGCLVLVAVSLPWTSTTGSDA